MDFAALKEGLVADGYSDDTAYARIAHDVVLKAVRDSGFRDWLTIKGGVVMSLLTGSARRATMDMDIDFLKYPLTNDAVRRFVSRLNSVAPCRIRIAGRIETLRQQEYKGKRVRLSLTDESGLLIETKIDIGVHARIDVAQAELSFRVVTGDEDVVLLANTKELIFAEKLKSLLRFGSASTRFKDVFDMYYLSRGVGREAAKRLIRAYILDDQGMREKSMTDILARLSRIFGNRQFMRSISKPVNAWLDISAEKATSSIIAFLASLH